MIMKISRDYKTLSGWIYYKLKHKFSTANLQSSTAKMMKEGLKILKHNVMK